LSERKPEKYGAFGEIIEDPTRCIETVYSGFGRWSSFHPFQCSRKRGFGKDGLYCTQHAKRHPSYNPIDQLSGCLAHSIKGKVDAVELVRAVRDET
jgi:hypothetical protein